jgi:hypothetical protein
MEEWELPVSKVTNPLLRYMECAKPLQRMDIEAAKSSTKIAGSFRGTAARTRGSIEQSFIIRAS